MHTILVYLSINCTVVSVASLYCDAYLQCYNNCTNPCSCTQRCGHCPSGIPCVHLKAESSSSLRAVNIIIFLKRAHAAMLVNTYRQLFHIYQTLQSLLHSMLPSPFFKADLNSIAHKANKFTENATALQRGPTVVLNIQILDILTYW